MLQPGRKFFQVSFPTRLIEEAQHIAVFPCRIIIKLKAFTAICPKRYEPFGISVKTLFLDIGASSSYSFLQIALKIQIPIAINDFFLQGKQFKETASSFLKTLSVF